jgi:hypothetical protein
MKQADLNRFTSAKNFSKFIPFCETFSHLYNVDPNLTPIQAAIHFRDFWQAKYLKLSSNILHKNVAQAFLEQFSMAEKRFEKVNFGEELKFSDFETNFFHGFSPEFSNTTFLMETFYRDPSMFFENYEDFVDFSQKNDISEYKGDVESQQKNDIVKNIGDLADSHPKNGSFAICGFFAFFHYKKSNFRIFMNGRFCNTQSPYFCIFARFYKLMSRVGLSRIQFHEGRGHRFLLTLENKISKFKTFNNARKRFL